MCMRSSVSALLIFVLTAGVSAQANGRVHPYLEDRLSRAGPAEKLPVYFTFADRLTYDHWFPRIDMLPIEERRDLVVAELKAHAARCQAKLLDELRKCGEQGQVEGIVCNWLGNFVHCKATPIAIRALADLISRGRVPVEHIPHHHPQAEIAKLLCDPSLAKELLGWEPKVSLEEGIERLEAWLRDGT